MCEQETENALAKLLCKDRNRALSVFETELTSVKALAELPPYQATAIRKDLFSAKLETEIASVKAMAELLRDPSSQDRQDRQASLVSVPVAEDCRFTTSELAVLWTVVDEAERLLLAHGTRPPPNRTARLLHRLAEPSRSTRDCSNDARPNK